MKLPSERKSMPRLDEGETSPRHYMMQTSTGNGTNSLKGIFVCHSDDKFLAHGFGVFTGPDLDKFRLLS
jgi:hypothetical protein